MQTLYQRFLSLIIGIFQKNAVQECTTTLLLILVDLLGFHLAQGEDGVDLISEIIF